MKTKVLRLGRKKARPPEDIIRIAQRALANCNTAEEFTIVIHDLLPPTTFEPFLEKLWPSLGPNLRQLTISATLAKFPLILRHSLLGTLPNLTDLNIDLAVSRFSSTRAQGVSAMRATLSFMNALSETLQSFTISSSELVDVTSLFSALRYFPRLQKLAIHATISHLTVPYALTKFLTRHETTLKHFALGPSDATILRDEPDFMYETWVTQVFCGLDLPALQSLHIGLSIGSYPFSDPITPPLSSIRLPQLVSLALSDAYMSHDDIEATFSDRFDGNCLESLQLNVKELSPKVLDTLAAKLPHLVSLDMTFESRFTQNIPLWGSEAYYDVSS